MKKIYIKPNIDWVELHNVESLCVVSAGSDSLPGSEGGTGGLDTEHGGGSDGNDGEPMGARSDMWGDIW